MKISTPHQLFIGGQWSRSLAGITDSVHCPADGELLTTIELAGPADVDAAVQAADRAFSDWSKTAGRQRGVLLNKLADLVEDNIDELAQLEALEIGRPIAEPRNVDIPSAIATLRYYAGWADKIDGRTIASPDHFGREVHSYTRREPVGVVGAIVPWNAPTMISCWKLAPALAAGCTIVLKPAVEAPLAVLCLARLAQEAGFPAGTINIIPGLGPEAGAALVEHPSIAKLSFTGSPAVGKDIAVKAAKLMRPCTLELGGKAPQIIFEDADLDETAIALALGIFTNQGQICAAGSRILVHRSIEQRLIDALSAEANSRVIGHPLDPATTMGALISQRQLNSVMSYISAGISEGATLSAGGTKVEGSGHFVRPTVFSNVSNAMSIAREEIFGPVAAVIPFDTEEEAVRLANDSEYGLSANLWTKDLSRAHRVAAQVRSGTVWVNGGGTPDPRTVWGGNGLSGIGRELGLSAIQSHTTEKAITVFL